MILTRKLGSYIALALSLIAFSAIFLSSSYTVKPALAANTATGLSVTSPGCDLNGKVTVNFTWTRAPNFQPGNIAPVEQILDWAVTSNIDSVVGNTSYWGNVQVTGLSSKTVSGLFAPNIDYWWRINTDWGGFLGGWAPSTVSGPFNFSCPQGGQINLTANVSGSTVNFGFSPNANVLTALIIYDSSNNVVKDTGILGDVPSYTWAATGQPAGTYHAQVFVGNVSFSNQVTFTLGGAPPTPTPQPTPTPPAGACSVTSSNGWTLNAPTVSGSTVTFNFSPASNGNIGLIVDKDSTFSSFPRPFDSGAITNGQSSTSWNNAPPGTYCAVLVFATTYVSNAVSFTVGPANGGNTCSDPNKVWTNSMYCDAIAKNYFDSSIFTIGQSAGVIDSLNIMLWGHSLNTPQINQIAANKGALAFTGKAVASLYGAPPASGVVYLAQKLHDLNPVQPAFAAAGGIGYQTLGPVQKIWIAFRNIAYVGFILVFVIIGFMIMFRAHISPQTVATVQDSVPRLVIALILVTFSYAIAGFMIDIMFLFLNIAVGALVQAKLITGADYIFQQNVFQVIWSSWTDTFKAVASAMSTLIGNVISLPGFIGDLFDWAGGSLVAIIIGIAVLFIMFRVFLMLLMAYVMIVILTMFAPFFFLIQALPGNNGAKEWFKQMASNIAVFPTVALMFILAGILGGINHLAPGASSPAIQPGQIGQFPLIIGNLDATSIGQLIGIGFLLMTPAAADIVKNAFGGKGQGGGMNLGAAAMAGAGAGAAVVGAGARAGYGAAVTRGPIGSWRRASESRRQEEATIRGRKGLWGRSEAGRGGLSNSDIEKYGLGYPKKDQT